MELEITKELKEDMHGLADEYYEEAKQCFLQNKLAMASGLAHNAINLYKKSSKLHKAASVLNFLGVVYAAHGELGMSIDSYLEALDIAKENAFEDVVMISYNNIGSIYQDITRHDRAVEFFEKALEKANLENCEDRDEYYHRLFMMHLNLGISYTATVQYKEAEFHIKEARTYNELMNDMENSFFLDIAQAQLLWETGDSDALCDQVEKLTNDAVENISLSDYSQEIKNLCTLFMDMSEFDAWKRIIKEFEQHAQNTDNVYYKQICCEMWMRYYRASGDVDRYNALCVEYVNIHVLREQVESNRMCEMIDLKLNAIER